MKGISERERERESEREMTRKRGGGKRIQEKRKKYRQR
jgi:hypothetical protein